MMFKNDYPIKLLFIHTYQVRSIEGIKVHSVVLLCKLIDIFPEVVVCPDDLSS